ncbi:MAG: cytochrome c biogenesis protein CcsA [Candidatus Rokuibacteriota bacterium]
MHPVLFSLALIGYICATGLALAYLVQREELVHRVGAVATLGGWACHTIALLALAIESGRPPIGTLPEAISVAVWGIVLLGMWVERHYDLKVLPAFILPIVVVLSLQSMAARPASIEAIGPALGGAWVWVHIALALVGIVAFVLNFAGAIMYLLQERQLKTKRPGAFYYRLPALETLDRLSYRTLALGFPFLTTGLILGALWAQTAWGSLIPADPMALFSLVAWVIYAGTLAGRTAGGWRGRRAAYSAIVGFVALVVTLGAGLFLPGKHGS